MTMPNSSMQAEAGELRYTRQRTVFPLHRRQSTAIAALGGESNEGTMRMLLTGAAALGIGCLASDFPGRSGGHSHWFLRSLPHVVKDLNPEAEYYSLDPESPAAGLPLAGKENAWIVQAAHDPAAAAIALTDLAAHAIELPTLLVVCAPAGLLVSRFPSPAVALNEVCAAAQACRWQVLPPGGPELAVLAGGLVLNEVMLGRRGGPDSSASHLVGFYHLGQPRRTMAGPEASFADLMTQIVNPPDRPTTTFRGRRFVMAGAGAIGTWVGLILALEQQVKLDIYDGDTIETHNLNRQVLFAKTPPGRPKALALAEELASLDPQGTYRGTPKYVTSASDLESVADGQALICAPDNDAARLLCADIARAKQVLFATGGSSPTGGQIVLSHPEGPCFRCVTGQRESTAPAPGDSQSCARAAHDAVVCSNMVVAGLLLSEVRTALAGTPTVNLRFEGHHASANHLARMVTQVRCPHRNESATRCQGA